MLVDLGQVEQRLVVNGGPFEITRAHADALPFFVNGPHDLNDIYKRAELYGSASLIVCGSITYTYDDIFRGSSLIAKAIIAKGGELPLIGLAISDESKWVRAFVAVTSIGSTAVLFQLTAGTVAVDETYQFACDLILRDEDIDEMLHCETKACSSRREESQGQKDALIAFTSGSTGTAKAIVHTHGSIVSALKSMMLVGALAAQMDSRKNSKARKSVPTTVVLTPLFHVAGYSTVLLAMLTGGSVVFPKDRNDPLEVVNAIHKLQAQNALGLSIDLFRRMMRIPEVDALLASLVRFQLHGSRISEALKSDIAVALPRIQVMTGYGLSETGGTLASAPLDRSEGAPDATGRLSPAVDVRIVDSGGCILPEGRIGHLQVRGPMLMRGYTDEGATTSAFTLDGWFRTGDMACLHPDRWIEIVGRAHGRMLSNEDLLLINAIEDVARAYPGIDDACASVDAEGQLLIDIQPMGPPINIGAFTSFLMSDVYGFNDVQVRSMASLPKTPSGKIDRALLGKNR